MAAARQVRLQLRQPWRDGTTDVLFDPVEFLGRLAVPAARRYAPSEAFALDKLAERL